MAIALLAASAIGGFFTAPLITVFVLTVGRGRRAIRKLLDMLLHGQNVCANVMS